MRQLLFLLLFITAKAFAQEPHMRILGGFHQKWYHSYLRLIQGGDDHIYLVRTREGSYWGSSQEGERSYDILRFSPQMQPAGHFQMKTGGHGSPLVNSFEFVPTASGMAVIGAVRTASRPGTALAVCRPSFTGKTVAWACDTLLPLPDHIPGISKNRLRMAWAADSSCLVLTWRQVANSEGPDNPAGCVVLDRDLRPLTGLLTPLSHVQADVSILGLGITDPGHIYFHLRIFDGKGLFQTPQSVGSVLARYEVATQTLSPVLLGGRRIPLDVRFLPGAEGDLRVVGTYLGPVATERGAGLFSGQIGPEDSLMAPSYHAFEPEICAEIVLDQSKNGVTTLLRPMGHNALIRTPSGWVYTLHLRGQASHPQRHRHLGPGHNQALIAWPLDDDLAPGKPVRWTFFQESRTDYLETFSWMPIVLKGRPYALVTDYSAVKRLPKPQEAFAWCLPLDGQGPQLKAYSPMDQNPPTVLAPRHTIQVAPGHYWMLARNHKLVQLIDLSWRE